MDRLVLPNSIVDFRREEVCGLDGKRINLRPRAFSVPRCLADHGGRLVGKNDLLAECWPGTIVTDESLTQRISDIREAPGSIREALGSGSRDVTRTVPRRGYMLIPPERPEAGCQPVRRLLGGSIRGGGTDIVITVQLFDGRDSFQVWAERSAATPTELFGPHGGLAARIAARVFRRSGKSKAAPR